MMGTLIPYWSLYLKSLDFTALEIGQLMALIMTTRIISPNVWGWIADYTGRRMLIVRLGSALSAITFLGVFWAHSYWPLALTMLLFSFFWNATLPQVEATTLTHLGASTHRYSAIRLWGSVGFIVTAMGVGPLLELWSPAILPPLMLVLFISIWVSSLLVPEGQSMQHPAPAHGLGRLMYRPEIIALLAVGFLMQASHGPYYTFYTIYMEEYGYSRGFIGQLWSLGVVAEIAIFLAMHRLVPRFGLRRLWLIALALTTLRWTLIGIAPLYLPVMLFAQILHAFSFGVFHVVAIALVHIHFTGHHQGRGQALYASLSFGAGGAVGALCSGIAWDHFGGSNTYLFAAVASFMALLIAARGIGDSSEKS